MKILREFFKQNVFLKGYTSKSKMKDQSSDEYDYDVVVGTKMETKIIEEKGIVEYTEKTFDHEKKRIIKKYFKVDIPTLKIFELENVVLVNRIGIYSENFLESYYCNVPAWFETNFETYLRINHYTLWTENLTRISQESLIDGICLDLRNYDNSAFSHFIFESFQKLFVLNADFLNQLTIILSNTHKQYAYDLIKVFFPFSKILIKNDHENMFCKKLIAISSVAHNNVYAHPYILANMRNEMIKKFVFGREKKYSKLIYIDRDDERANIRKIYNEDLLKSMAIKYGFQVYTIGKMPFEEKVNMLHHAEIIIGQYGGGLQLSFVCQPKTKILLLQSPHFMRSQIAQNDLFGIEVVNLIGLKCTNEEEKSIKYSGVDGDKPFRINEESFHSALDFLLHGSKENTI